MSERIRFHSKSNFTQFILCSTLLILLGCEGVTEVNKSENRSRDAAIFSGTGSGRVYLDNPSILNGRYTTSANFRNKTTSRFITDNTTLSTECSFEQFLPNFFDSTSLDSFTDSTSSNCMNVLNDRSASTDPLISSNLDWDFTTHSDEFYQVSTFYHANLIRERFLESLSFTHKQVHLNGSLFIPPSTKYNFIDTRSYWLHDSGSTVNMDIFSKCQLTPINAFFDPANNQVCLGFDPNDGDNNFLITQDPSVTYHEMGHVFVKILMNQRNMTSGIDPNSSSVYYEGKTFSSDLGDIFYDEGGAINEGIADWFAYYMNNRDEVGEFALYRLQGLARPVSEDSDQHTTSVSTTSGERLSYPQYLQYNPPNLGENVEDVHNAGTIISHYLVALQKELKNSCTFSTSDTDEIHEITGDYMVLLLSETMAEIGDLTAKGSDFFSQYATVDSDYNDVYFTNLNEDHSYLWTQKVNPPNFRRFFRIFGKNILYHLSVDLCPEFTIDDSEKLLDDYGLLLFKSYEDRGNGIDLDGLLSLSYFNFSGDHELFSDREINPVILNTKVNEDNRRNTVLIAKDFIELDDDILAFVVDGQKQMADFIASLTFQGENVETTEGIAGTEYNNSNAKISPGEVIGISLNLFNKSNSVMAGVQVLANDWDHMALNDNSDVYVNRFENINGLSNGDITGDIAYHKPCMFDEFPSESEGAINPANETGSAAGECSYITRTNAGIDTTEIVNDVHPKYDVDAPQPICLVQYRDEDETTWVSQDFFRKTEMKLDDKDCLNNPSISGPDFNPNACLIRMLPGAEHAFLSKINAQSTWVDTLRGESQNGIQFNSSAVMAMEVNKWIPPGTLFNCRFRVRFSNCSDCFNDSSTDDDLPDYEFAGPDPYKIINFQFEVLD
ncbi:MAG: hypothetical protein CME65_08055 [Halobacteriovoraceae bacterium]|nr:hypothetical protein [Halobacteriovoraceae bacterium]|tara:strand:- start:3860 stop:6544 length:2685 start_codon:yes stop_codon:yes gene_type:complete